MQNQALHFDSLIYLQGLAVFGADLNQ